MKSRDKDLAKEIDLKFELLENLLQQKRFKEALAEVRDLELTQKFDESSTDFGRFCYYSAEVFRKLGDYQTALSKANKAFDIFKNTNENKRIAQIKYTLGNIHIALGDLKTAQEDLHDSLATYKRIDDDRGKITVLFMLSNVSFQQAHYQMAIEYLLDSIKLCDKIGEKQIKARGLGNLGTIHLRMGNWQLAKKNLLLNIKINEESNDWLNLCKGSLSLGYMYSQQRDFKKAKKYYEKALKLIYDNNYMREMAIYYEYYAELAFAQGNYFLAKDHCKNGIKIGEEIAPAGDIVSQTYQLLAEVQIAEKQYDEALSSCEKALKVAESLGEKIEIGAIHRAFGQIYTAKKEKEKAKENFEKSISILEQIGARFELGKAYLEAGKSTCFDFFDRVQYLGRAKDIFKELDSGYHEGLVQRAISELFFEHEEYEKALLFLNDAEKMFKELKEEKELSSVLSFRRILEKASGKFESAIDVKSRYTFSDIITHDQKMQKIIEEAKMVKDSELTILLEGETGTGKDLLAKTIHYESKRKNKKFVVAQCSAIPETLLENALFGHIKGAYTGANESSVGLFEEAAGGTLYLDEIAEIPLSTQVKLLRAIEEKEITRIGETKPKRIDVRIIASTSRNLTERVSQGLFRQDLYFRLNALSFKLLPLRERKEDIRLLIEYFLQENGFGEEELKVVNDVQFIETILGYDWPGNVRELKNEIEKLATLALMNDGINLNLLKERISELSDKKEKPSLYDELAEFEKKKIMKALEQSGWIQREAARVLGIPEASLRQKIKRYNIKKPTDV